jgi:diadenosine tetraphosphate (Ap4A) HIT family hydrolase
MAVERQGWTPWAADWPDLKAGVGCKLCSFLATEDPDWGIRIYTGRVATGFLSVRGQIPGYSWVIWNSGHVCEPTELSPADARAFFADMLTVGSAVEQILQPAKMNYEILGNNVPHLHAHVLPRPQKDPIPRGALPWTYLDDGRHDIGKTEDLAAEIRRRLEEASGDSTAAGTDPARPV